MQCQTLVARHINALIQETEKARPNDAAAWTVKLVAADTSSAIVEETWPQLASLREAGFTAQIVFGKLNFDGRDNDVLLAYEAVFGIEAVTDNLRLAAPRLATLARERLILGNIGVWTGERLSASAAHLHPPGYVLKLSPSDIAIAASHLAFDQAFRTGREIAPVSSARVKRASALR